MRWRTSRIAYISERSGFGGRKASGVLKLSDVLLKSASTVRLAGQRTLYRNRRFRRPDLTATLSATADTVRTALYGVGSASLVSSANVAKLRGHRLANVSGVDAAAILVRVSCESGTPAAAQTRRKNWCG